MPRELDQTVLSRTRHSSVWVNVNERRLLDVVELKRVDDIGNAKFLEDYYYLELLFLNVGDPSIPPT
jgi:hypothetical protein